MKGESRLSPFLCLEMNAVSEPIPIRLCQHQRGSVVGVLQRHGDGSIHYNALVPNEPGVDSFCSLEELQAFFDGDLHTVSFRAPLAMPRVSDKETLPKNHRLFPTERVIC